MLGKVAGANFTLQDKAAEKLAGIMPMIEIKQLRHLCAEGYISAISVNEDGKPGYCVWIHRTIDGCLHINAAAQIGDKPIGFEKLVVGMEAYAKAHGCNAIRFHTQRAGLVAKAEECGYSAHSICMMKKL